MEMLTIKQASKWASEFLNRKITKTNISYLVQYGRVKKNGENGNLYVAKKDLENYYNSYNEKKEIYYVKVVA